MGFESRGSQHPKFLTDFLCYSLSVILSPIQTVWDGRVRIDLFNIRDHFSLFDAAKSTVSRLNASPQENAAREQRMASAIRTILECIGEDPDREGLKRTPERYAQAVMWMTRGYEERLAGQHKFLSLKFYESLKRRSSSHRRNQRCYFCGRP